VPTLANPANKERGLVLEKQFATNVLLGSILQIVYPVEIVQPENVPIRSHINANPVA
jgi:hypothetical protein